MIVGLLCYLCQIILQNNANRPPKIYHQIKWMVDTQPQNPCSYMKGWNPEYNVCMKGILPRAMAGHFILRGEILKLYKFKKEERTNKLTSYIAACDGDSGSGHWVTINDETLLRSHGKEGDNERRALVAVFTKAYDPTYKLTNGKLVKGVCGGIITSITGEKKAFGPFAIKTTHAEILKFIKKWALVCKDHGAQGDFATEAHCSIS